MLTHYSFAGYFHLCGDVVKVLLHPLERNHVGAFSQGAFFYFHCNSVFDFRFSSIERKRRPLRQRRDLQPRGAGAGSEAREPRVGGRVVDGLRLRSPTPPLQETRARFPGEERGQRDVRLHRLQQGDGRVRGGQGPSRHHPAVSGRVREVNAYSIAQMQMKLHKLQF